MYQKHQRHPYLNGAKSAPGQILMGVLSVSSAFLILTLPAIIHSSGSKLLAQEVVSQDLDAAMAFQQGVTFYSRKDFQNSEIAFRTALDRDPNIGLARNYLGNILLEQNRLDLAIQEYGEAIRLNPSLGEAYYNLGVALQRQGQKEAAITAYRQALVVRPTLANAHYNLGVLFYQQEQRQDAIAAYEQAINLDRNHKNAYFNLAIVQQQEGQIDPAISAYRQVLKIDPENAVAYNNLGSLLVIQGKITEAITVYKEAIRQNPKNALAYYNLGVTLYNQGAFKESAQAFRLARKQYTTEGNTEQLAKTEQLIQQIAQVLTPKKSPVNPPGSATAITTPPVEQAPANTTPTEDSDLTPKK